MRMPLAIVSALVPPFGMVLLLIVLALSVGKQPVALVVSSSGPFARRMAKIIEKDTEAYLLAVTDTISASKMLAGQEVAAVITIPLDFDSTLASGSARVNLKINNIDIDFSDDIRRSVDRSVAQFDAPGLGLGENENENENIDMPNPYLIHVAEDNLRTTNVDFLRYQVIPALVLLVLSIGLTGTALMCALDRERGTGRYLIIAPASSWSFISGRILGGLLAAMAVLVPSVAVCILTGIVSVPMGHWPALVFLFLATGLCSSGLGTLVGSLLNGSRLAAMASSTIATFMFFLGGGFTTIAFLPNWLRNLSSFIPFRYSIEGLRQILFYPGLEGVALDLAVLAGSALLSVFAGAVLFRRSIF